MSLVPTFRSTLGGVNNVTAFPPRVERSSGNETVMMATKIMLVFLLPVVAAGEFYRYVWDLSV